MKKARADNVKHGTRGEPVKEDNRQVFHSRRRLMRKPFRYLPTAVPTQTKPTETGVDLILKIATAFLISFAVTLVLVHAEAYFAS
jgi:hypothetical protein